MATETKSYKCEFCGKLYPSKMYASACEVRCHERKMEGEKKRREYHEKVSERIRHARDIARDHKGIKLLVEHKLYGSARVLCRDAANFLWDCGTSSGWEKVYTEMIRVHDEKYTPEY